MKQLTEDERKEKARTKSRAWRLANPDKAKVISDRQLAKRAVSVTVLFTRWRNENPSKYAEYLRKRRMRRYAKDPAKDIARSVAWAKKNPEANRAKALKSLHKSKAEKKAALLLTP